MSLRTTYCFRYIFRGFWKHTVRQNDTITQNAMTHRWHDYVNITAKNCLLFRLHKASLYSDGLGGSVKVSKLTVGGCDASVLVRKTAKPSSSWGWSIYSQWASPANDSRVWHAFLPLYRTRKRCYREDDRAMSPIYGFPENFWDSLTTPTATFPEIFHGLLFRSTLWVWMCVRRIKFEVRSFTRSWDNRGTQKISGSPWLCSHSLFLKNPNRLSI